MIRPAPSMSILSELARTRFEPDQSAVLWAFETLIDDGAQLCNEDFSHLRNASIGWLWTNEPNSRHGRSILATCEMGSSIMGSKWQRARAEHQLLEWFDDMPDFILTFFAPAVAMMEDREFMALVEHELCHAGQAKDEFGNPKFSRSTGKPIYSMRGHDVEEFVSVVRRYGSTSPELDAMLEAVQGSPEIPLPGIARACGNCLRLVS